MRGAHLTFLANPNSPSGTMIVRSAIGTSARNKSAARVVLDEAYVDFADANGLALAQRPNVIVTRTLSKSYALAGIRFGFAVADPAVDPRIGQGEGLVQLRRAEPRRRDAALEDQEYLQATRAKILTTRTRLAEELHRLGFEVTPSQANFVWCPTNRQPVRTDLRRTQAPFHPGAV